MNTRVLVIASALLISPSAFSETKGDELRAPLSLDEVLRFAREHRREISAARARARSLGERPAIVSSLEDPMISPSIDHLPFMLHGLDASLTIEQRFPLSRIRGHRERAAEADASRARAEGDRVELDIDLDATNAFYMLHERRRMRAIVVKQLELANTLKMAANARYAAATGGQAEVLRAESEVARLEGDLRAAGEEIAAAEAMFNASIGRDFDVVVPELVPTLTTSIPPSLRETVDRALSARPELRVGRAEVSRAEAEVAAMQSMYWPMAMVRTGPAYTMADGAGWMLMVGISIPIFREKLGAGVREAEAMVDMSRADVEAMARMIEGEAAAARAQVAAARERYLALRDHVLPLAERAIAPSLAGYGTGNLPLVSVIEAARALWGSEGDLIDAEVVLGLACARLDRAMGKRSL